MLSLAATAQTSEDIAVRVMKALKLCCCWFVAMIATSLVLSCLCSLLRSNEVDIRMSGAGNHESHVGCLSFKGVAWGLSNALLVSEVVFWVMAPSLLV